MILKINDQKDLVKNKVKYYQFLNKLFPSNYSQSKINKLKRQRLNSIKSKENKKILKKKNIVNQILVMMNILKNLIKN